MNKMLKAQAAIVVFSLFMLIPLQAKEVTFTTRLKKHPGEAAYFVIYLTDGNGGYQQTFWVGGKKYKYYKSLHDWAYGSKKRKAEYDGKTGASLKSGGTFTLKTKIDDALLDAGYQIRIDTAIERAKRAPSDVVADLTIAGMGKPVLGKMYIQSFTYAF